MNTGRPAGEESKKKKKEKSKLTTETISTGKQKISSKIEKAGHEKQNSFLNSEEDELDIEPWKKAYKDNLHQVLMDPTNTFKANALLNMYHENLNHGAIIQAYYEQRGEELPVNIEHNIELQNEIVRNFLRDQITQFEKDSKSQKFTKRETRMGDEYLPVVISAEYLKEDMKPIVLQDLQVAIHLHVIPAACRKYYGNDDANEEARNGFSTFLFEEVGRTMLKDASQDSRFADQRKEFLRQVREYVSQFTSKHSRNHTAARLVTMMENKNHKYSDYSDMTRILQAEYHVLAKSGGKLAKETADQLKRLMPEISEKDLGGPPLPDLPFDRLAITGARAILSYVDNRERSFTHKRQLRSDIAEERLKDAGLLAHELLLCKNDTDLNEVSKKIRAMMPLITQHRSTLAAILKDIQSHIEVRQKIKGHYPDDNDYEALYAVCKDKIETAGTSRAETRTKILDKLKLIKENTSMDPATKCTEMRMQIKVARTEIGGTFHGKPGLFRSGSTLRNVLKALQISQGDDGINRSFNREEELEKHVKSKKHKKHH